MTSGAGSFEPEWKRYKPNRIEWADGHWGITYEPAIWPILDDHGEWLRDEYAPGLWWAYNGGVCCYADTPAELIAEIAAGHWKDYR